MRRLLVITAGGSTGTARMHRVEDAPSRSQAEGAMRGRGGYDAVRDVPVPRSFYLFATTRDRQRMPSSIPCSIAFFLRRSSS